MPSQNFLSRFLANLIERFLSVPENKDRNIGTPKNILIVRQHNQFGDLLASVSLFRAVKETFPESKLTLIVSPENYYAITKNKYIDKYFIFNKKKIYNPIYFLRLRFVLKRKYDLTIVPATVSISKTSCMLGRLANSKFRIGPKSLNGKLNQYHFLFDRKVDLNWKKFPDSHISDFGLEIVRPFGITTKNFRSSISCDIKDEEKVEKFISTLVPAEKNMIIGLHIGAGKPHNRWSLDKFIKIMNKLNEDYSAKFYITGSSSDKNELDYFKGNCSLDVKYFLNKSIPLLAALIGKSDLFITNDTGVMHVAGATDTPQISIFGPTNPFNWAPLGPNKYFVRKSDLIDDVTVEDVYKLCKLLLGDNEIKENETE
jgi:heptosyltransferase-2